MTGFSECYQTVMSSPEVMKMQQKQDSSNCIAFKYDVYF